jgi:integrase
VPKKNEKRRRYKSYAFKDAEGKLYARVQVRRPDGTYRSVKRRALNLTHVDQLVAEIKKEFEDRGAAYLDGRAMTFKDLAEWYKEEFVIDAVYVEGKKVAGMRTWASERNKIDRISTSIGGRLISEIDELTLRRFKLKRLKTVGIAAANRDLETVRTMLRKAKRMKWIKEVPDFAGLIEKSLENRRTVTISDAEEKAILAAARAFTGSPRLYALILALRDSGARPNELYPVNDYGAEKTKYEPLRWRDVMVDGEILPVTRVVSYKGRKRETRLCVITDRMKTALEDLWIYLSKAKNIVPDHQAHPDTLIFPHTSYKRSWEIVRENAGVPELRLRDLRRDWSTRLARLGYSDRLAQRGMGHSSMQMTYEYTEFDMTAALAAKAMLDQDNAGPIDVGDAVN